GNTDSEVTSKVGSTFPLVADYRPKSETERVRVTVTNLGDTDFRGTVVVKEGAAASSSTQHVSFSLTSRVASSNSELLALCDEVTDTLRLVLVGVPGAHVREETLACSNVKQTSTGMWLATYGLVTIDIDAGIRMRSVPLGHVASTGSLGDY